MVLAPVRGLIERRAGCNHFAGEEPYDAERARDLRCAAPERDEHVLRRRYAERPDILRSLAETRDVSY